MRIAGFWGFSELLIEIFEDSAIGKLNQSRPHVLAGLHRKEVVEVERRVVDIVVEKIIFGKFYGFGEIEIRAHQGVFEVVFSGKDMGFAFNIARGAGHLWDPNIQIVKDRCVVFPSL